MTNQQIKSCKTAGKKLYNQLTKQGLSLTYVGVGLASDGSSPAIHLGFLYKKDMKKCPTTFGKYEVSGRYTGVIRAR